MVFFHPLINKNPSLYQLVTKLSNINCLEKVSAEWPATSQWTPLISVSKAAELELYQATSTLIQLKPFEQWLCSFQASKENSLN